MRKTLSILLLSITTCMAAPRCPPLGISLTWDNHRRVALHTVRPLAEVYRDSFCEVLPKVMGGFLYQGVKTVMPWLASSMNVEKRDPEQMKPVYQAIIESLDKKIIPLAHYHKAFIFHQGRTKGLPDDLLEMLEKAKQETAIHQLTGNTIPMAVHYDRDDQYLQSLLAIVLHKQSTAPLESLTASELKELVMKDKPIIDLSIRLGGGQRHSNGPTGDGYALQLFFEESPLELKGHEDLFVQRVMDLWNTTEKSKKGL